MERLEASRQQSVRLWAKQKLQTEEILQLVERGVPAWDMLAKVAGKNAVQLEDLEQGQAWPGRHQGAGRRNGAQLRRGRCEGHEHPDCPGQQPRRHCGRLSQPHCQRWRAGPRQEQAEGTGRYHRADGPGRAPRHAGQGVVGCLRPGLEWVERFIKRLADVDSAP
ncbi:tape measure protein [Pseudomonas aeruginosa]|nr:tape measure protein [Pseudomonas aeruginosa]